MRDNRSSRSRCRERKEGETARVSVVEAGKGGGESAGTTVGGSAGDQHQQEQGTGRNNYRQETEHVRGRARRKEG